MRRQPLLSALFPEVRQVILAETVLRPEKSWFLTELANVLGKTPSSLQREIQSLSAAGILRQWHDGRRLYIAADATCPIFVDLASLLEKTAGLFPILKRSLQPLGKRIVLAFVYGSVAHAAERNHSDVDLLIVGSAGLSDLTSHLRTAEQRLGRPINPTVFSRDEFLRKRAAGDHFLTSVLKGNKLFIKGGEDELEAMAHPG